MKHYLNIADLTPGAFQGLLDRAKELKDEWRAGGNPPLLQGKTLGEANIAKRTGMLVMAIKSPARGYRFNPGASTVLKEGDILIVVGTREQIAAAQREAREWLRSH